MDFLNNRFPPVLVACMFAALMWLSSADAFGPVSAARLVIALPLLMLGMAVCLAGVNSFRRARTTVNPLVPQEVSSLVSSGIYRHSRNPMYLGFAVVLLSWATVLGTPQAVIGVVGFIAYINRFQIAPEERVLLERFGTSFTSYQAQVRRWI